MSMSDLHHRYPRPFRMHVRMNLTQDLNLLLVRPFCRPNMAGKSSYIKQVALIAILGHVGSYVPAVDL